MYDLHSDTLEISPSSKISGNRLIGDRPKLDEKSFTDVSLKAFTRFRSGPFPPYRFCHTLPA